MVKRIVLGGSKTDENHRSFQTHLSTISRRSNTCQVLKRDFDTHLDSVIRRFDDENFYETAVLRDVRSSDVAVWAVWARTGDLRVAFWNRSRQHRRSCSKR